MQSLTAAFVTPNADEAMRGNKMTSSPEGSRVYPRTGNSFANITDTPGILRPEWDHVGHAVGIERSKYLGSDARWDRLLDDWARSMAMCTHRVSSRRRNSRKKGGGSAGHSQFHSVY